MLSLDSDFYKSLLSSPSFTSNFIIPDSLALEVYFRSHLRHYSLSILNDLAGAIEKLSNDISIAAWMPSLAGVLVISGRVVFGMSFPKVEIGASSHASQAFYYRQIDEFFPDPLTMLLGFPVTKPSF